MKSTLAGVGFVLLLCSAVRSVDAQAGSEKFTIKGAGAQARDDGLLAASEGRFADAVPLLKKAARAPPTRTTLEKMAAARIENSLGGALKALGRRDEAITAFQRAISLLEGADPGEGGGGGAAAALSDDLITVVSNLGSVHADAGRISDAEALYERALRIDCGRRKASPHGDNLADALNILAGCRAVSRGALTGVDDGDDGGDDDDDDDDLAEPATAAVADTLNNLADLRHGQGRLNEARRLHERALAIRERALGAEHVDIAASLNNVAVLLMDLRKHGDALPLLERAAKVSKAAAGKAHPSHATALANLAGCQLSLGRVDEARRNYKRAVGIHTKALGAGHESTAAAAKGLEACDAAEARQGKTRRARRRAPEATPTPTQ